MANFFAKYSIMTQEMVDSFCESFYIPAEVHPTAPGRNRTIAQFPAGKVGVYTRIFDVCGYRIPFTKFFMTVLKYFRVHISQLSPFGVARVSHFEVLTRVLNLAPSVAIFRAFYTRSYSDGLFSFAKRSTSAPSCFSKPPDSIKNWAYHFFWVDSCVFLILVPLYTGGILEKDPAPHLTAHQEQTVKLLEIHKAPFRRYPECFLCLVGLSPYYPFDEYSYSAFEYPNRSEMGLFNFIKTADPQKVQAVEVQKGEEQVKLLESTQHCFMPLKTCASGGSSSASDAEVPAPTKEGPKDVAAEDAYLELADSGEGMTVVRQGEEEVVTEQPKKTKRKRLVKQSDVLPAKKLRADHPSLASGTGGKTLAGLEHIMPTGSRLFAREQHAIPSVAPPSQESESFMDLSSQASLQIRTTMGSAPVDAFATATTSIRATATAKLAMDVNPDMAGPSQLEESEGSDDSFYEPATFGPSEAKRCMDCDQLYTKFNVGASRQICLGLEVRSRAEHELELKEKLRAKYVARSKLLEEKDLEILRLKSQLAEKEAKAAEVIHLRDQVSLLSEEKSALTAKVSALNVTITQKDHDISLLDSRATHLASSLDDAKVACAEAGTKITLLASERDRLSSEVCFFPTCRFSGFQGENGSSAGRAGLRVVQPCGRASGIRDGCLRGLEGEFYPTYLTLLAGRRWLLNYGIQLAHLNCLEAGHEHGVSGRSLSVVDAYNPEVPNINYVNTVKALEDVYFPLVDLLKSKKDIGMDEVLDCFLLDGPLVELPEAAFLQLSIPIHHASDKTIIGDTSLSFALMNVHARAEGAKKHAAALRQLMM
ncbi:hypothetical protein Tco_0403407 [Tanacetum coccineum]